MPQRFDSPVPFQLDMPDLSGLTVPTLPILLAAMAEMAPFAAAKTNQILGLQIMFARLVDRTISDYQLARTALIRYAERSSDLPLTDFFDASAHLESCIGTMHRALRAADRLKRIRNAPKFDRRRSVFSKKALGVLGDIRDAVEHMDERLFSGTAPSEESPLAIGPKGSYLRFEGLKVPYERLADWIEQLHETVMGWGSDGGEEDPGEPNTVDG